MKQSLPVVTALAVVVVAIAFGIWSDWLTKPGEPRTVAPNDPAVLVGAKPERAPHESDHAPASSVSTAIADKTPMDSATFFRDKIQARLNALADAYNAGDAQAADRALDENHAVIRPDGRTLYRSDVLGQWAIEWTQLRNRSLVFEVEFIEEEGESLKASWTVDLRAELLGEDGEVHDFEFNGSQLALYRKDGDNLLLQEPIRYTRVYQTIDGDNVNPHQ